MIDASSWYWLVIKRIGEAWALLCPSCADVLGSVAKALPRLSCTNVSGSEAKAMPRLSFVNILVSMAKALLCQSSALLSKQARRQRLRLAVS